jgi:hypothetical protein
MRLLAARAALGKADQSVCEGVPANRRVDGHVTLGSVVRDAAAGIDGDVNRAMTGGKAATGCVNAVFVEDRGGNDKYVSTDDCRTSRAYGSVSQDMSVDTRRNPHALADGAAANHTPRYIEECWAAKRTGKHESAARRQPDNLSLDMCTSRENFAPREKCASHENDVVATSDNIVVRAPTEHAEMFITISTEDTYA